MEYLLTITAILGSCLYLARAKPINLLSLFKDIERDYIISIYVISIYGVQQRKIAFINRLK